MRGVLKTTMLPAHGRQGKTGLLEVLSVVNVVAMTATRWIQLTAGDSKLGHVTAETLAKPWPKIITIR